MRLQVRGELAVRVDLVQDGVADGGQLGDLLASRGVHDVLSDVGDVSGCSVAEVPANRSQPHIGGAGSSGQANRGRPGRTTWLPRTGLSPDKMLLAGGFSYADAHGAGSG